MIRRYIAVIQDPRGYPPPGAPLDMAPPDGPDQAMIYSVVKAEEHEAEVKRLREALRDAVDAVSSGQRDTIGRHEVYTVQIDVSSVERWRDASSESRASKDRP